MGLFAPFKIPSSWVHGTCDNVLSMISPLQWWLATLGHRLRDPTWRSPRIGVMFFCKKTGFQSYNYWYKALSSLFLRIAKAQNKPIPKPRCSCPTACPENDPTLACLTNGRENRRLEKPILLLLLLRQSKLQPCVWEPKVYTSNNNSVPVQATAPHPFSISGRF